MTTKRAVKKAPAKKTTTKKVEYFFSDTYGEGPEGPFSSLMDAQDAANRGGYTEFDVFTLVGKYEAATAVVTFKERK